MDPNLLKHCALIWVGYGFGVPLLCTLPQSKFWMQFSMDFEFDKGGMEGVFVLKRVWDGGFEIPKERILHSWSATTYSYWSSLSATPVSL